MEEIIVFTVLCIIISSCFVILPTEGKQDNNNYNNNNHIIGFSTELIHRDSPLSPLFNPNCSSSEIYQRKDAALRRRYLQQQISNNGHIGRIDLIPDAAEYLMKMSYGTPPVESFSMIDTGSSLSWIQCLPCTHCFPSVTPPFNPQHSSTFEFVTDCRSKKKYGGNNNFSSPIQQQQNSPCRYNITYLDQTYSRGEMARETIRVGSRDHMVTFRRFLFGCGHDNGGYFPHGCAGLVGFSPDQESFIGQLREHHGLKFSHCIAPTTSHTPGKLSFGRDAVISGHGVVSTPLYTGENNYAVELEYINIGNTTLRYLFSPPNNNKSSSSSSNRSRSEINGAKILIDTGSEAIHLPESLQMGIDLNVQKLINLRPTSHMPFTLCYPSSSLRDADIPKITFHFQGASVELGPVNTFVVRENKRCMAILPNDEMNLFGNTAMTNFVVAYDLHHNRISFKPTDCSRY